MSVHAPPARSRAIIATLALLAAGLLAGGDDAARFELASPTWPQAPGMQEVRLRATVGGSSWVMPVAVWYPSAYFAKPETRLPVMIGLHNGGNRGSDGGTMLVAEGLGQFLAYNMRSEKVASGRPIANPRQEIPCVVLLPQCPADRWWTAPPMLAVVLGLADEAARHCRIDVERVALTG